MRYFSLLILLLLSKFTSGQLVFTKFENVILKDDFSYISNRWEQKNTSSESFFTSGDAYTVKRLKNSYFAISVPNHPEEYAEFELVALISIKPLGDNRNPTGGLVLKAQQSGDGAIILEFNRSRKFRIRIMKEGKMQTMFGNSNGGWLSGKNLKSNAVNEIKIKTAGNQFDLYFNGVYERSFIETTYTAGKIGLYAGAQSVLKCDDITLRANESFEVKNKTESTSSADQTYTELAKVFKTKIDKQQAEINALNEELNKCKSNLILDTTAISQNKILSKENAEMKEQIIKLESDLETATERLSYLESMKADIESNPNGDLILNLTELLSKEKAKSEALQKELNELKNQLNK